MRKRPLMPKAYRSYPAYHLRNALMVALSLPERIVPSTREYMNRCPIPDLADLRSVAFVVKSVSFQSGVPALASYDPSLKIIYVVRHPCGFAASLLTGMKQGKMPLHYLPDRADLARLYSFEKPVEELSEADFSSLEILAYRWAVFNDFISRDVCELPNVTIVRYEDICADPITVFKALFRAVEVSWDQGCEAFLKQSLSADQDAEAYHDLVRAPLVAANKWRSNLSEYDINTIKRICRVSGAAFLYPDLIT